MVQAELIKFWRYVATVAIQHKQLIYTNRAILYMLIEHLLKLDKANLIYCLAIITYAN